MTSAMTKTEPAIYCSDLVRIFSAEGIEVQALQGLSLRVLPGEMVAVIGASGSGKSTLLTILSGLDTPTAGVAKVAGFDLLALSKKQRLEFQRHKVGFVWQQTSRNLLPYLTAYENIAMPIIAAGGKEDPKRIMSLLEMLEVGAFANRLPNQLSGGQQQRVAIAVALANEPEILLADEPTGELDRATSAEVLEAMRRANQELGVTVLIVTHDQSVSEHVPRTVQIRDGRTATEVLRRTELSDEGEEYIIAEEFAVLDRVGRLQLPQDFIHELEMKDRVRLALEFDRIEVFPDNQNGAEIVGEPSADAEPREFAQPGESAQQGESAQSNNSAQPDEGSGE
ncbi:MAG: ABC transporter ATP-binding protein [Microbacteriaceae bacterium]